MTITCTFLHEQNYLKVIASGPITFEEVRTHLLIERHEHGLAYPELIDAGTATPSWTSAQAREIVSQVTSIAKESALGPTAIVVSDAHSYGMIRMLEILLDQVCILRPFYHYDEAVKFLQAFPSTTA